MLKNDIETAIETLIALKGAKPDQFESALARVMTAQAGPRERERNASLLAESLIKGPFSEASLQTILEIKASLPRSRGAVAYLPRDTPRGPQSLIAHAMSIHGPLSEWAQALFNCCSQGFLPFDRQAAADLIWLLEAGDSEASRSMGLEDAQTFAPALRAFFSQTAPWDEIFAEAAFCPVAWISANWLGSGDADTERMAAETLLSLLPRLWPARPGSPWMAALALRHAVNAPLADPLFRALDERSHIPRAAPEPGSERCGIESSGPLLEFCRHALPGPAFARVARLLAQSRPEGLSELDEMRCAALYWINARMAQTRAGPSLDALAEAFLALVDLGASPLLIAPQISLRELANHPVVFASLEAFEISQAASPAPASERRDGAL